MSPLYRYLLDLAHKLIDVMDSDTSVFFLDGFISALAKACDPMDAKGAGGTEFSRVMLLIQVSDSMLHSGAVALSTGDFEKIAAFMNVSNLPTDL